MIATGSGPLVAEPSWTRFDMIRDCRCYGFDGTVGRQSEFDVTEAGTARVYFHDLSQTLNDTGLIGKQIMLQLWDPVLGSWEPRFRGRIDDIVFTPSPGAPSLANVEVVCVGVFSYLSRTKFIVGQMGDLPLPGQMSGVVFYEDGPAATGTNDPNDGGRVEHLFYDSGLESAMYVAFSLNVDVNETLYDPSDTIIAGLRDAVSADFPGLANLFEDRFGRACAHGRLSRFDPDTTAAGASTGAWDFHRWSAGTRGSVGPGVAQIQAFQHNIPADRIVNSYLAWPQEDELGRKFDQSLIETLVRTDASSISSYGYCGIEKGNLIIKEHKTNGNTGAEECGLFGDFYIANYAQPRKNIQQITFKTLRPTDSRAAATWALMTQVDVSDIVSVNVAESGISAEDYFVEGISFSCRPGAGSNKWDFVEVGLNLSPAAYFTDNVFEDA